MLLALEPSTSIDHRVQLVVDIVKPMCQEFLAGKCRDGVETFQSNVMAIIAAAGLSDVRWILVDKVGVHPDNREKAGLVPIDVHDLLFLIALNGWNWKRVDAVACEIPPTAEGIQWRAFNKELADRSDDLLAPVNPDLLEILTVRGSHTTAAVRCMLHGTKGIHEEVCQGERVSKSKVYELQPSMQEPEIKGIPYTVIRYQLVVACPQLMEILSRTGNASHGVERTQTALQGCMRVHALAVSKQRANEVVDYAEVARMASVGMPPSYFKTAIAYGEFVKRWSGGIDAPILKKLEFFERSLSLKRNISPQDFSALAKIDLEMEAPRYVPAMVMAMLAAPANFVANGFAALFKDVDYASLCAPNGRNRSHAISASDHMKTAETFFSAYAKLTPTERTKILGELDIRIVLHVHQKRSGTRREFSSILHILAATYDQVQTLMSDHGHAKLPVWPLLKDVVSAPSTVGDTIAEVNDDAISDGKLLAEGFKVGAMVARIAKGSRGGGGVSRIHKIEGDKVTLVLNDAPVADPEAAEDGDEVAGEEPPEPDPSFCTIISRAKLLTQFMIHKDVAAEVVCFYLFVFFIY